jgi:hypothetical protein
MEKKSGRKCVEAAINSRLQKAWESPPAHPAVDWGTLSMRDGRMMVDVTCPVCGGVRHQNASQIKRAIKDRPFDGRCYKHRLFSRTRKGTTFPAHPLVDWNDTAIVDVNGEHRTGVAVTCPDCNCKRYQGRNGTKHHILNGRFSGRCHDCSGRHNWVPFVKLGPGRSIDSKKGYVRLNRAAIADHDMPLYLAMATSGNFVFEHRFIMAKQLGRPLTTNELVDHMDGVKTNNAPKNLRLYVRGKNQPGEMTGYGTYYHEWQKALARIRVLEERLGEGSQHRLFKA